jgi:hypothetical protein
MACCGAGDMLAYAYVLLSMNCMPALLQGRHMNNLVFHMNAAEQL